jgi:hypothetical protein
MDKLFPTLSVLFFFCCPSSAQLQEDSLKTKWAFSVNGYYYFVPEENSLTLITTADHNKLHFEARYNYEDHETASAFAGWRLAANGEAELEVVPMLGIVFGNTNGLAPALELSAAFRKFDFYSESEYVFDFSGKENNFLYTWGELAINIKSFRTGLSWQRTLLYQTDYDIQHGVFAEYSFGKLTAGTYYFNPFSGDDVVIISLGFDF